MYIKHLMRILGIFKGILTCVLSLNNLKPHQNLKPDLVTSDLRNRLQNSMLIQCHIVNLVFFLYFFFSFFFFWPCCVASGILVPQPGIEPAALAVKAPSPNHCTAREFPVNFL